MVSELFNTEQGTTQNLCERPATVVKYSSNDAPENFWNLESVFSGNSLSRRLGLERATDHCKVFSEEERPLVEIHHKTAEEMSFSLYQYKRKYRDLRKVKWMKDKKGQDEQTEQLILENINNTESRRINSLCSWRSLEGNQSTNHNNKRLLWKSKPGKSLEFKIFIITENRYSVQD